MRTKVYTILFWTTCCMSGGSDVYYRPLYRTTERCSDCTPFAFASKERLVTLVTNVSFILDFDVWYLDYGSRGQTLLIREP
jgi:hypothetical protein